MTRTKDDFNLIDKMSRYKMYLRKWPSLSVIINRRRDTSIRIYRASRFCIPRYKPCACLSANFALRVAPDVRQGQRLFRKDITFRRSVRHADFCVPRPSLFALPPRVARSFYTRKANGDFYLFFNTIILFLSICFTIRVIIKTLLISQTL